MFRSPAHDIFIRDQRIGHLFQPIVLLLIDSASQPIINTSLALQPIVNAGFAPKSLMNLDLLIFELTVIPSHRTSIIEANPLG
jgi:hypothetical protein